MQFLYFEAKTKFSVLTFDPRSPMLFECVVVEPILYIGEKCPGAGKHIKVVENINVLYINYNRTPLADTVDGSLETAAAIRGCRRITISFSSSIKFSLKTLTAPFQDALSSKEMCCGSSSSAF